MLRDYKKIFWTVFFLILLIRVWGLPGAELRHDAALNSMRAVGWLDFLVGQGQTTPLVWFGEVPWWANLSFHDHPPLSFLLQHVSFRIFGDRTFVAFLPFVIAGVLGGYVLYRLLTRAAGKAEALLGMALFGFSSYLLWAQRAGYLEGLSILFIVAATWWIWRYAQDRNGKFLYFWSLVVAAALLTKYTAIFLLPAAWVFLFFYARTAFSTRQFWLAHLLILLLLSPVIFYNYQVFAARGHFDAAFSSMVGMSPEDFSTLSYRSLNTNFLGNLSSIWSAVKNNTSLPLLVGYIFALGLVIGEGIVYRRGTALNTLALLNLIFVVAMFSFSGAADRFVVILVPFLIILLFGAFLRAKNIFPSVVSGKVMLSGVAVLLLFELAFSINTNLLASPLGSPPHTYSPARFASAGYETLDRFFRQQVFAELPSPRRISRLTKDVLYHDLRGKEAIIFDERADWFSRVWYVDRYKYYYSLPFVYLTDISEAVEEKGQVDPFDYLRAAGVRGFWVVVADGDNRQIGKSPEFDQFFAVLSANLEENGIMPVKKITGPAGQSLFKVYHFQ
ncbi:MAG: glycosyltransferase family 39 protein [Candidatus Doudnabacteria bacterium]|nr:glycosyltransferase family 39 protein [Candidatus Doudnabacteria bacterium]